MSETPVVCLALPTLFDAVVARFDLDSFAVEQTFGWREPARAKVTGKRIVWVPGDEGGNLGSLEPPKKSGSRPAYRSLATLQETFTVYIGASDPQFPENERSQYEETRKLYDAWVRAVYLAAHGTFRVTGQAWNLDKNERRHGAEIVAVCWVEAVVPDAPYTDANAALDVVAEIETSLDNVDEVTTTASP